MKYTLTTTAIALAMSAAANAAAPTVWQGAIFITVDPKSTNSCSSQGINTGDFVQAIFAPQNAQKKTPDQLAVIFPGSAHQFVPASGTTLNKATSVTVTHINHNAGVTTSKNTTLGPIQISSPDPVTQSVTISKPVPDIGNGTVPCKVTFNGALTPRPGTLPN